MVLEAGCIHWVHLYLYMAKHSTDSSLHRHLLPLGVDAYNKRLPHIAGIIQDWFEELSGKV